VAKELAPRIWDLNGQMVFPVHGKDGGLQSEIAVYVVIGDVRKEVRFTWRELETREEATATQHRT
jgi:hypothetical protein